MKKVGFAEQAKVLVVERGCEYMRQFNLKQQPVVVKDPILENNSRDSGRRLVTGVEKSTTVGTAGRSPQGVRTANSEVNKKPDKAYEPDSEGFIRNWLVLTAIPFRSANPPRPVDYEPLHDEANLCPREGEVVQLLDRKLAWKAAVAGGPFGACFLDFNALTGTQSDSSVAFAVCYVYCKAELTDLTLRIGSGRFAKAYLNGEEVETDGAVASQKDQGISNPLTLKKGMNVVVFKVGNYRERWLGCVRFTRKRRRADNQYKNPPKSDRGTGLAGSCK